MSTLSCKNQVTVMCDYAADGLWIEGAATDAKDIATTFGIPWEKMEPISNQIDIWQGIYEDFDFWSNESDPKLIKESSKFKEFLKLGEKIAIQIRGILPDEVEVIYFDDGIPARFYVLPDGQFKVKEIYG